MANQWSLEKFGGADTSLPGVSDIPSSFDVDAFIAEQKAARDRRAGMVADQFADVTDVNQANAAIAARQKAAQDQTLRSYWDAMNNAGYARQAKGQFGGTEHLTDAAGAGAEFAIGSAQNRANAAGARSAVLTGRDANRRAMDALAIRGTGIDDNVMRGYLSSYDQSTSGLGRAGEMRSGFESDLAPYRAGFSQMLGGIFDADADYTTEYARRPVPRKQRPPSEYRYTGRSAEYEDPY
jgi:hypothetical protein